MKIVHTTKLGLLMVFLLACTSFVYAQEEPTTVPADGAAVIGPVAMPNMPTDAQQALQDYFKNHPQQQQELQNALQQANTNPQQAFQQFLQAHPEFAKLHAQAIQAAQNASSGPQQPGRQFQPHHRTH